MADASMSIPKTIAADMRLADECLQDARALLKRRSRNAAYLCSQAAEHLVRAVASSEGLHIERSKAHLIDTTIRRFPDDNLDKTAFLRISDLERYSTTYRYPSPTGRIPPSPAAEGLLDKLDFVEELLDTLLAHFGVLRGSDQPATSILPRRASSPPQQA